MRGCALLCDRSRYDDLGLTDMPTTLPKLVNGSRFPLQVGITVSIDSTTGHQKKGSSFLEQFDLHQPTSDQCVFPFSEMQQQMKKLLKTRP